MMTHVRASFAAEIAEVNVCTIHRWARQGRLNRYPDGYDLREIFAAMESRDPGAVKARAGVKGSRPGRV